MTTPDKPPLRVRNDVKQILFVVGAVLSLFHLLALALTLLTRDTSSVVAMVFLDVTIALVAGLVWLSQRIFPADAGEQR